jgi:hypothetical protein
MQTVSCKCGFTDEYEPDEFGLSYYQAIGTCPECGADLGTAIVINFRLKKQESAIKPKKE